jgi:tetratricopeptide (TPR) repeat protein
LNLNAYYMRPIPLDATETRFLLSLFAVVAVTSGLIWFHKRFPGLLASWLAYLVLLAPNSGLVVAGKQLAADRYCYLASMAWTVPLAWWFYYAGASSRRSARMIVVGGLVATAVLVRLSLAQAESWENSVTLWSHAVSHGSADTPDLYNNLAMVDSMVGDHDKALLGLREAIRLRPDYAEAYRNMGLVLLRKSSRDEAISAFSKAIEIAPEFIAARADLASALTHAGRHREASAQYQAIAALQPESAVVLTRLGYSLVREGKLDQARARFQEALRAQPGEPHARAGLKAVTARRLSPVPQP